MKRIGFAVLAVAFGFLYIMLMVWAWGSWTGFFSDPARTGLVIVALGLIVASTFSNTSGLGSGVREDKSNRWILVPLIAVGFVIVWLAPYLDRHNEWVWGGETVRWVGLAVATFGGILRIAPVFELGRRFSGLVAIQKDHVLKTDGLYSTIRHPSYVGLLVSTLGWCLVFRCVVPGLIVTAVTVAAIVVRMNSEEKLLSEQFGDEYAAYRAKTWRLIPHVY